MIYFDMDGVIANFVKKMGTLGVPYPFTDRELLYSTMKVNYDSLYADLDTIPGYAHFFSFYLSNPGKVKFLSGVPSDWTDDMMQSAWEQKATWIMQYMKRFSAEDLIVCRTNDKPNYCKEGDVLIDDRLDTVMAWNYKGGKGLYYFADDLNPMQSSWLAQYVLSLTQIK